MNGKTKRTRRGRIVTRMLPIAVAVALLPLVGPTAAWAADTAAIDGYAPTGTVNLAPQASVTSTASQSAFPATRLVDEDLGLSALDLWVPEGTTPPDMWANVAWDTDQTISRIVLWPRADSGAQYKYFPAQLKVALLDRQGAEVWSTVHTSTYTGTALEPRVTTVPLVLDLGTPVAARQLRLTVLQLSPSSSEAEHGAQLAELAAFGPQTCGGPEATRLVSCWAPSGSVYLSSLATPSAESTYPNNDASWFNGVQKLVDGENANGWTTNPFVRQTQTAPAWAQLDFPETVTPSCIALFPRNDPGYLGASFPEDFTITVLDSAGTVVYTIQETGYQNPSGPAVWDIPAGVKGDTIRLDVTKRGAPDGGDGYLVQLTEFAVWGTAEPGVAIGKPALLLEPGEHDALPYSTQFVTDSASLTWTSSDAAVATVADGVVTAQAVGAATITVLLDGQPSNSIPVEVRASVPHVGQNILITGFWAPSPGYVNQEQFANAADFGLDLLMGDDEHPTVAENQQMATLAAQNGFWFLPADSRLSCNALQGKSAADVEKILADYANVPGVGGLVLCDEAMPATNYATAFTTVREQAPRLYPHYNFCPWGACGVDDASVRAWLNATGGVRSDWNAPDYLMYDRYPLLANDVDAQGWLSNLDLFRQLGLDYQIKTATYLQSVGYNGSGMRRPSVPEITWEANTALAYGYKQLSYFTYWQPSNRGEAFTEGIMKADGTKSDQFDALKQLNSAIHALGPTLMKLDAQDVYVSGVTMGQRALPTTLAAPRADGTLDAGTFFVSVPGTQSLLLSHMVDRDTKEHYLYVVNSNFVNAAPAGRSATLTFDPSIVGLEDVSRADGSLSTVALDNHQVTLDLGPAEGHLFHVITKG